MIDHCSYETATRRNVELHQTSTIETSNFTKRPPSKRQALPKVERRNVKLSQMSTTKCQTLRDVNHWSWTLPDVNHWKTWNFSFCRPLKCFLSIFKGQWDDLHRRDNEMNNEMKWRDSKRNYTEETMRWTTLKIQ